MSRDWSAADRTRSVDMTLCLRHKRPRPMIDPQALEGLLLAAFPDAQITISDLTGTQDHYEATIVSRAFEGQPLIVQHQMVYRALGTAMHGPIHALALKTSAPHDGRGA